MGHFAKKGRGGENKDMIMLRSGSTEILTPFSYNGLDECGYH